jgi:GNAT superfamily N-acetyltransferase
MAVTFRSATTDDLAEIVALLADDELADERGYGSGGAVTPGHLRAFADIDADPRQVLLVAEDGGSIVATAQLTFVPGLTYDGGERCLVEAVRVAASARGTGLGTRLLEHAIGMAEARGCVLVQLTSDKRRREAIRFYERLGFTASHEGLKLRL